MTVVKTPPKVSYPVRMLPIEKMVPTPDNRRRPITRASVESLAKSMAKDGVLQPIVVRENRRSPGSSRSGRGAGLSDRNVRDL